MKWKRIFVIALVFLLTACSPAKTEPAERTTEPPAVSETIEIDKEKAETLAKGTLDLLNAQDADALKATFDEEMHKMISDDDLKKVFQQVAGLGTFQEVKEIRSAGMKGNSGKIYTIVAVDAVYSEREVSFSFTYDENDKLAGMFMQ